MKHIRTFEGLNQTMNIQNLQEFCNEHLVDLIDIGFEIEIYEARENSSTNFWGIRLLKRTGTGFTIDRRKIFNWNQVKDKFIPFYEVFRDNYIIKSNYYYSKAVGTQIYFATRVGQHDWVRQDNLISDSFHESFKNKDLMYIEIRTYGEK